MNSEKTHNTLFNRALDEIKTNKKLRDEGKHIAIPYPFPRLSRHLAGTTKGRYIIVTANSKVGKTKLADFLYVYSPIWFKLNNKTNIKPKVIYFTLEMSKEDKMMEAFCEVELLRWIIMVWMPAVPNNHGTKEAFSTGSQAQYPPNERVTYAQYPPKNIAVNRATLAPSVHGSAGPTHSLYFRFQRAAIAKQYGTVIIANPTNKIGG